jgi:hypothetical protein
VVQNHPDRAGPDLGRNLLLVCFVMAPTFSGVGASDQPGAVQYHEKRIHCDPFLDDYTVSMRMLPTVPKGTLSLMRVNGYDRRHLHIPETA